MENINQEIEVLINAFVKGTITEGDFSRLENWAHQSEAHRKYVCDVREVIFSHNVISDHTHHDVKAAIERFHKHISKSQLSNMPQSAVLISITPLWKKIVRIAASKVFKNLRFPPFIDFCKIASRYVLAKSKMVGLTGVSSNNIDQVTEAVTIAQLSEHHYKQLIPASKMLYVFITFVFHYNSVENSLRQELYKLREYIFSGVHRITDLFMIRKDSQFKSSPSVFLSKTLCPNKLQTYPLVFSGH
ncbi:hypothetical protein [Segatella asaccharophila]|jgi:hypothetical protein